MLKEEPKLRQLQRNDPLQNFSQFKINIIKEIQKKSGELASCIEADVRPSAPTSSPAEPVKPNSNIMALLIARLSSTMSMTPTELDVWEDYGIKLAAHRDLLKEHDRSTTLALVDFPRYNKDCFSILETNISEATILSICDVATGVPGADKAYKEKDTFAFLKMAGVHVDNVPADVKGTSILSHKTALDTYRQRVGSTIDEHVAEYRRREKTFLDARGSPFLPYELTMQADSFLKTLDQERWGGKDGWIDSRNKTGTMKTDLSAIIDDLRIEETRTANLLSIERAKEFDIKGGTAHATSAETRKAVKAVSAGGGTTSKPVDSTAAKSCSGVVNDRSQPYAVAGHTKNFTPRFPSFTRCNACQAFYRARVADGSITAPVRAARPKAKSGRKAGQAHRSEAEEEDEGDDEEYGEDEVKYGNFTMKRDGVTFVTIAETDQDLQTANQTLSESSGATRDDFLYFDNCANSPTIRDLSLAIDVRKGGRKMRISGSVPGGITVDQFGRVGDIGRCPCSSDFAKNLISENALLASGWDILHNTKTSPHYFCSKDGRPTVVFELDDAGLYKVSIEKFKAAFPELYNAEANNVDVTRSQTVFTKGQRYRAEQYWTDHHTVLCHTSPERVISALAAGLVKDSPYTEADVRNSKIIFGDCRTCALTKGTKHRRTGHYPSPPQTAGEKLVGDLFFILGCVFMLVSCRLVKLRTVRRLRNKSSSQIMLGLGETFDVWKHYGASPKLLGWDQEPAIVACEHEIMSRIGVKLELSAPGVHQPEAERNIRTVKEPVYAYIKSLPHAVDAEMVDYIIRDVVSLGNLFPTVATAPQSPRSMLDGERLDYRRYALYYPGMVGEVAIPYTDKSGDRKETVYVLGHRGNNPVVRILGGNQRLVIREKYITPISKTPAIIKLIEDSITGNARVAYNDMMSEIGEYYATIERELGAEQATVDGAAEVTSRGVEAPTIITFGDLPPVPDEGPALESTAEALTPATIAAPSSVSTEPTSMNPIPDQTAEAVTSSAPEVSRVVPSLTPTTAAAVQQVRPATSIPAATASRPVRAAAQRPVGFYSDSRNNVKSKERESFATSMRQANMSLHHPEDLDELYAFHMHSTECAKRYGKEKQETAGLAEVINLIGRTGLHGMDSTKMTSEEMTRVLPAFMFYKAKDPLPGSDDDDVPDLTESVVDPEEAPWTEVISRSARRQKSKPSKTAHGRKAQRDNERDAKAKIRARLVGGGNHQHRGPELADQVAPTARSTSHNILLTLAALENRGVEVGDVPSAYLQTKHVTSDGLPIFVRADRETTRLIVKAYPDMACLVRPDGTMILRVDLALYGLVESAWLWYKELVRVLEEMGYTIAEADRGLAYKFCYDDGKCIGSNFASLHVDDILCTPSNNESGR